MANIQKISEFAKIQRKEIFIIELFVKNPNKNDAI